MTTFVIIEVSGKRPRSLLEEDGEDEDDELDDRDGSGSSEENEDSDGDGSDDSSDEDATAVPSLEEVAVLYTGPECWRYLVDSIAYAAICRNRENETGNSTLYIEPNFGTKYWRDELPADLLSAWDNWDESPAGLTTGCSEEGNMDFASLSLPHVNPYIPIIELSSVTDNGDSMPPPEVHEVPLQISIPNMSDRIAFFRYLDVGGIWTKIPKIVVAIKLSSSIVASNIHLHVANDLIGLMVLDALNETLYMVSMAGITCQIEADDFGFTIVASGFRDKMPALLSEVIERVFDNKFLFLTENRLKTQSEFLLRRYNNEAVKAGSAASTARRMALLPSQYSGKACQQILMAYPSGDQTILKLRQFMGLFLHSCNIDVLVHGSCSDADSISISQLLSESIGRCPRIDLLTASERHAPPVSKLPAQSLHVLRTAPQSPTERNICVEAYFQAGGYNVHTLSFLDLLEQCLSEPFFNDLRTKQQVRCLCEIYLVLFINIFHTCSAGLLSVCQHSTYLRYSRNMLHSSFVLFRDRCRAECDI